MTHSEIQVLAIPCVEPFWVIPWEGRDVYEQWDEEARALLISDPGSCVTIPLRVHGFLYQTNENMDSYGKPAALTERGIIERSGPSDGDWAVGEGATPEEARAHALSYFKHLADRWAGR